MKLYIFFINKHFSSLGDLLKANIHTILESKKNFQVSWCYNFHVRKEKLHLRSSFALLFN